MGKPLGWICDRPAIVLAAALLFALSTDRPALHYDSYHYAGSSLWLYGKSRPPTGSTVHSGSGEFLRSLFETSRPPFYFPACLILLATGRDWSVRAVIFLNSLIYTAMLLYCIHGIAAALALDRKRRLLASSAATATLMLSVPFWDASTTLMAEVSVAAVLAWLLKASIRMWQTPTIGGAASLGLACAWGIFTKPIFLFHAAPLVLAGVAHAARHGFLAAKDVRGRSHHLRSLMKWTLAGLIPLAILVPAAESLRSFIDHLYLLNEVMLVYIRSEGLLSDVIAIASIATETFPILILAPLMLLFCAALASRAGRWLWIYQVVLLLYVALWVNHRAARLFPGLFLFWALLSATGVLSMPARTALWAARSLSTLAITYVLTGVFGVQVLDESLFRQDIVRAKSSHGGRIDGVRLEPGQRALLPRGNEYAKLRIPEVVLATGAFSAREPVSLVTFSLPRYNSTTFGGWLLEEGAAFPHLSRFVSNEMRFGGWGLPGGLRSEFFTLPFVVTKSGKACQGGLTGTQLYCHLLSQQLAMETSPFRAGLELHAEYPLDDGSTVTIFRRVRSPAPSELEGILRLVYSVDPGNIWNFRYAESVFAAPPGAFSDGFPGAFAGWILSAGSPDDQDGMVHRYPYYKVGPELAAIHRKAAMLAEDWLARR